MQELAIGFCNSLITAGRIAVGDVVLVDVEFGEVDFKAHRANGLDVIGESAANGVRRACFEVRLDSNGVERNILLA